MQNGHSAETFVIWKEMVLHASPEVKQSIQSIIWKEIQAYNETQVARI